MNSSATTENSGSPKRVRVEDESTASTAEKKQASTASRKVSPTKRANDALHRSVESLPSSLANITIYFGEKVLSIRSKLYNKSSILKKMNEDDSYIPKSARASDFQLSVSKLAADSNSERLNVLEELVTQAKFTYEQTLRGAVQECLVFEQQALQQEEQTITCEMLHSLAKAVNLHIGAECDPHLKVTNLISLDQGLFRHTPGASSRLEVREMYRKCHSLGELPPRTIRSVRGEYGTQAQLAAAQAEAAASMQRVENKGIQLLRKCVESALVIPGSAFLDQQEANKRAIELKKLETELISGKATEETAMELEAEGSASREQLQELIAKEVANHDKKYMALEKKYLTLEKELKKAVGGKGNDKSNNRTKNDGRQGAKGKQRGQRGASDKKKTAKGNKTANQSHQGRGKNQADGDSNDTGNDNSGNRRRRSRSRSRSSQRNSNNSRNRR